MGLSSCLFRSTVVHDRRLPVGHRFTYSYLAFYLDLGEIDALAARLRFFSKDRFNLFSYRDSDHIHDSGRSARERLEKYSASQGVALEGARIFLLTQLRLLGFLFNPVSFYFCFRPGGEPLCAIAEVNNTFGEMKYYFLGPDTLDDGPGQPTFRRRVAKHFYVSPFVGLEEIFDFRLAVPGDRLALRIDDLRRQAPNGPPFLRTSLTGRRHALTDAELLRSAILFPLTTLKVWVAIHWQAWLLLLKGLPYLKKHQDPHLQTEVYDAKRR